MWVICELLHLPKQGNVNVKSIHQCTLNVLFSCNVYGGNNDNLHIYSIDRLLMLCKYRFHALLSDVLELVVLINIV